MTPPSQVSPFSHPDPVLVRDPEFGVTPREGVTRTDPEQVGGARLEVRGHIAVGAAVPDLIPTGPR